MTSIIKSLLILVGFFILLFLGLRLIGGFAPGWIVKCKKCGKVRKADEAGIIRVGKLSGISYTIDWCSKCRKIRWHSVEVGSVEYIDK